MFILSIRILVYWFAGIPLAIAVRFVLIPKIELTGFSHGFIVPNRISTSLLQVADNPGPNVAFGLSIIGTSISYEYYMECKTPKILLDKKTLPGSLFGVWGFIAAIKRM